MTVGYLCQSGIKRTIYKFAQASGLLHGNLRLCNFGLHRVPINRRYFGSGVPEEYDLRSRPDPGHWRSDPEFQKHNVKRRWLNLKGPTRRQPLLFFRPSEKPVVFVTSWLSVFFLIYSIFSLGSGETIPQRRRRMLQDRLYREHGVTENDVDEIEGMEDAPLSDEDSESYGAVMDPLLEPKEDVFAAWLFEPHFEKLHHELSQHPTTSHHPAVIAMEQLQQRKKELPAEIRDFVKKSDAELLVNELLERKDSSKLSNNINEFPGEEQDMEVRLPRKIKPTYGH